jgi:hypothetical protein
MIACAMDILTVVIVSIHDHLFRSSSIFFINVLPFLVYRSFTFLVKLNPKTFSLTLNRIVAKIFWIFHFVYALLIFEC